MDPWPIFEKVATLSAAGAAAVAVLLGRRTLRLYTGEREARRRSQAAAVLSLADLLRRRFDGFWRPGVAFETTWPGEETLQRWEDDLSQDIGYAEQLAERASFVDPRIAVLSETLGHRCRITQFAIGQARRSKLDFFPLGSGQDSHARRTWIEYRLKIVTVMTETLCVLGEIEAQLEGPLIRIQEFHRDDYRKTIDQKVRVDGETKAKDYFAEIEKNYPNVGSSVDGE